MFPFKISYKSLCFERASQACSKLRRTSRALQKLKIKTLQIRDLFNTFKQFRDAMRDNIVTIYVHMMVCATLLPCQRGSSIKGECRQMSIALYNTYLKGFVSSCEREFSQSQVERMLKLLFKLSS